MSRRWRSRAEAPSVAAASSRRGSSPAQNPPTIRTTTATLKKTCARRIAQIDRSTPSGSSARNAVATTTVGSTNGTSTRASTSDRPRNENRARAQASGRPASRVSAVETAACQRVNQAISSVDSLVRTSRGTSIVPSTTRLRSRIAASGHTKKTARNASGTATVAALSARRCLSIWLPSGRGSRRSRSRAAEAASRGRSRARGTPRAARRPPAPGRRTSIPGRPPGIAPRA